MTKYTMASAQQLKDTLQCNSHVTVCLHWHREWSIVFNSGWVASIWEMDSINCRCRVWQHIKLVLGVFGLKMVLTPCQSHTTSGSWLAPVGKSHWWSGLQGDSRQVLAGHNLTTFNSILIFDSFADKVEIIKYNLVTDVALLVEEIGRQFCTW